MPTVSYASHSLYIALASAIRLIAERLGCDQKTALRDFTQAAQEGAVETWGEYSNPPAPDPITPTLNYGGRHNIHPTAWRNGIVDAAHKRLFVSRDFIWIEIQISRKGFEEVWPELARGPVTARKAGRPQKSIALVKTEMRRRAAEKRTAPTLAEEARNLHEWLKTKYPNAPLPTVKTIENNLSRPYRELTPKYPENK